MSLEIPESLQSLAGEASVPSFVQGTESEGASVAHAFSTDEQSRILEAIGYTPEERQRIFELVKQGAPLGQVVAAQRPNATYASLVTGQVSGEHEQGGHHAILSELTSQSPLDGKMPDAAAGERQSPVQANQAIGEAALRSAFIQDVKKEAREQWEEAPKTKPYVAELMKLLDEHIEQYPERSDGDFYEYVLGMRKPDVSAFRQGAAPASASSPQPVQNALPAYLNVKGIAPKYLQPGVISEPMPYERKPPISIQR